ncbi:MAG: Alpha-D-glucose 1-phosphate phosphatase YihX [Chlamydiae bacterium]|nr:Alpha-D-glucose 1-phosphate phosphatase YihX [Chlamydiota bacterium]
MKCLVTLLLLFAPLGATEYEPILFNAPFQLKGPVASISNTSRETITLDPEKSPVLEEHFQCFLRTLPPQIATRELFESLCDYIKNTLFDPKKCSSRFVAGIVQYLGEKTLPIDTFAAARIGLCRHQVLVCAYFLQRLQEEGWLEGKTALVREQITSRYGYGSHAWCLFADSETVWHLDPYWNIVDHASSEHLINTYGAEPMKRAQNTFTKKRVLFFDIGGVLLNFSHEKMCENLANYCEVEKETIAKFLFEEKLGIRIEEGSVDSPGLTERLSALSGKTLDLTELKRAASEIFSPKEETISLLKNLKAQGARLYILSNTCDAHFEYIKAHYDFVSLFDGFILSYELGVRKPDEKIYQYALELADAPKESCAYIDDIEEYTEAAGRFGIDSHHFESAEGLAPALVEWGYAPDKLNL